jgi:hypothetical protein
MMTKNKIAIVEKLKRNRKKIKKITFSKIKYRKFGFFAL